MSHNEYQNNLDYCKTLEEAERAIDEEKCKVCLEEIDKLNCAIDENDNNRDDICRSCDDMRRFNDEDEYEYCNAGEIYEPIFGEKSYMVAGGGLMNGNAYATIELKNGIYYYCEYGKYQSRQAVGGKIIWSDEIYHHTDPYASRNFNIV